MNHLEKKQIRQIRTELGLSQEGFAHKLGVSFTTVNRWESGKSEPSHLAQKMLHRLLEEMQSTDTPFRDFSTKRSY